MVDVVSKSKRAMMMAGIRGKNTRPELIVRKFLHAKGFRYRLHSNQLAGSPDLVLTRYKVAIFVHGCFWHRHIGCRYATTPATRPEFWLEKLEKNRARDQGAKIELIRVGWRVAVVWECGLRKAPNSTLSALVEFILSERVAQEFSWNQLPSTE